MRVPAIRLAHRQSEQGRTLSAEKQGWHIDGDRSQRCATQAKFGIGHGFASPQRPKCAHARPEARDPLAQREKRNAECFVIEAREAGRASPESDLQTPATCGLSDRELSGQQEWLA